MTLKDWNNRQDIKKAWKAFYNSEAGQSLKNVLVSLGSPMPVMPPAGVDFIDWNASLNTRREGFFEAIRLLGALSEDSTSPEELPAPWEVETKPNQE
jgi:hypothetical protein